jgi:hypothetical protein
MTKILLTIFVAVLLTGPVYAGKAYARGGAEPMPMTSFTDLPPYRPKPLCCTKRWHSHPRYHPRVRSYW